MIKLSRRLQSIADRVTHGSRIADIGSDHALLPVYLVQSGKCPSAIAGELNKGPWQAAVKGVAEAGLRHAIDVRHGDGMSVLQAGEADTVTIAGMGGSLMSMILETGWLEGKLAGVQELVLQPNVGEDIVRRWLVERGYALQHETIMEEDGRIYEVLHAAVLAEADAHNESLYDPSFLPLHFTEQEGKELLYAMGPLLLREPSEWLIRKWELELEKLGRICGQMSQSDTPEAREKEAAFRREMSAIREVLGCLPTVRPSSN
ncbi:class I SAM-dependent methyltransferase [Paenibacillus oenotherae]|uniref:Class I SAM-dependent methyltransferase n=1 Tax=Paenibacillus oenotherae TaxID=1435645 RepID=A0ABS7D168_9BACL|nr:class I SAM-dependent methyltransferase [Paenibacillus oenotherae]MBW7473689.1 class I SAM-dependent methyltransferase [Paenibacillus oenotherae]